MKPTKWPNENGEPTNLKNLTNEHLLVNTQRLVDAKRRNEDDRLYNIVSDASEYNSETAHSGTRPLKFTGHLKQMVNECKKRGVPLNTDR